MSNSTEQSSDAFYLIAAGVLVIVLFLMYMLARPRRRQPTPLKLSQTEAKSNRGEDVKELNVIFQYNGHDFDAYQVLGVPAGSSLEAVRAAYEKGLATSETDSHEFLRTAYQAILRK